MFSLQSYFLLQSYLKDIIFWPIRATVSVELKRAALVAKDVHAMQFSTLSPTSDDFHLHNQLAQQS